MSDPNDSRGASAWDGPAPQPPSALRERLLSATRAKPSKTAKELEKRRWGLLLAALVPAALVLGLLGVGPKGRPVALAVLVAVGWTLVASASTAIAFAGRSPLGPSRPRLAALAGLAPLAALTVSIVGMVLFPDTWSEALSMKHHGVCMGLGLAIGAAPLAAMLAHLRGTDPVEPRVRGAALGAVAGAWGGAGTMLLCPHHTMAHVVVGHVLPVALFAVIGAIVGSRVLALRGD